MGDTSTAGASRAPLYGDAALQAAAHIDPACDIVDACGVARFLCVAESPSTPADKLGQTLAQITTSLTKGFAQYDSLSLSPFAFSPLPPLVDCA